MALRDHSRSSFTLSLRSAPGSRVRPELGEEVNNHMLISWWLDFAKLNWRKEEGQTMAEYGVVLAVITLGAVVTFGLLATGIKNALTGVLTYLP